MNALPSDTPPPAEPLHEARTVCGPDAGPGVQSPRSDTVPAADQDTPLARDASPPAARAVVDQTAATLPPAPEAACATDAGPATADRAAPESAAGGSGLRRFDDYELITEVARGGMGVVYKARQVSLRRIVAVKMILSRQLAGQAELRRFQTEAEAVARLQHPNIVQIHGVGESDGQPYLALEFVEGGSLAGKIAGTPQPPRPAAELIQCLARAIHCAHQRGIVHRDLKPANVLLTPDGVPKIADFGLAKRVEADAGETRTGVILGTPSYMAPEQAAGSTRAIGPAADVYALGAMLYEMLTGRPPFRAATPMETVVQVLADEPVPPRRLLPTLPRDLETICLKCLEKLPARRYASALDLADDLARFLEHQPIHARPVRAWERVLKWTRRRPATAALILVSAAALAVLLAGGTWYNTQLRSAVAESRRNLDTSQRNLGVAHGAVNAMLERVADDLASVPHTEHVRQRLLEEALRFYHAAVRQSVDNPAGRELLAGAYVKIGDIQRLRGDDREAEVAYHQSLAVSQPLVAEFPEETEYVVTLAGAHNNLGNLLTSQGHFDEAESQYRRAAELLEPLVDSAAADLQKQAGRIDNNWGVLLADQGKLAEAEALHRRALDLRLRLVGQFPGNLD